MVLGTFQARVELSRCAAGSTAREYSHCFTLYFSDSSTFAVIILKHDQLKANYTLHEAMVAMLHVLLLTSHVNHEGNLKIGRTYLQ